MHWFYLNEEHEFVHHHEPDLIKYEVCWDDVADAITQMPVTVYTQDNTAHLNPGCLYRLTAKLRALTPETVTVADLVDRPGDLKWCEHCTNLYFTITTIREIEIVKHAVGLELARRLLAIAKGGARARSAAGRRRADAAAVEARLMLTRLGGLANLADRHQAVVEELEAQLGVIEHANQAKAAIAADADRLRLEDLIRAELGLAGVPEDGTAVIVGAPVQALKHGPRVSDAIRVYGYATCCNGLAHMLRMPLWVFSWLAKKQISGWCPTRPGNRIAPMTVTIDDGISDEVLSLAASLYNPTGPGATASIAGAIQAADAVINA